MKTLSIAVLIFTLLIGCEKEDVRLTFTRQPYTGNQFKTDGLYYSIDENFDGKLYNWFFFYRNGILRYGGSSNDSLYYSKFGWLDSNSRLIWGLFLIDGNQIKFEQWTPENTWIYSGEILNDTTFHIEKLVRSDGKEVRNHDETFHFIKYNPKPDSVNRFVN